MEFNTPLMRAANVGALETVNVLLEAGADPNAVAEDGWTPLEAAEMIGANDVTAALVQAGAEER